MSESVTRRPYPVDMSHDEVVAEMLAAGYELTEPYRLPPESVGMRCTTCGQEIQSTVYRVRKKGPCKHGVQRDQYGPAAAIAEEIVRAAGYEPDQPYPGRTTKFWRLRCECGRVWHAMTYQARRGDRCPHGAEA